MYRWVPVPDSPDELAWADQGDAEAWLTGAYLDLLDAGITAVSLYEEDRLVYGPMSLEP